MSDRQVTKGPDSWYMRPEKNVGNGNGGGYDGGMDARIARLEDDVRDVKKDLTDIKVSVAQISGKLDTLTSTLASKLMGPWQMVGVFGGLLTTLIVIAGAVIGLMKWVGVLHISP